MLSCRGTSRALFACLQSVSTAQEFFSILISASEFQKIEATLAPNDNPCSFDTDTSSSSNDDDDTPVMYEPGSNGSLLNSQASCMGSSISNNNIEDAHSNSSLPIALRQLHHEACTGVITER